MISISNRPCFASELHACVHTITALQVVACPTSQKAAFVFMCVCVCVSTCLWECLFVGNSIPKGSDLFTKLVVSLQDSIVYKHYIIINFSVFVVLCFDRQRESQANDWIHILPPENPQNLFLSFCQQGHPNFAWVHHNVLGISSSQTVIQPFAVVACLCRLGGKGAASFYLKSIANRLFPPRD